MQLRRLLLFWMLLGSLAGGAEAQQTHVVYAGQRLGSIAKRYNVTVEELCAANGIKKTAPIKPGQRLVIPDKASKKKGGPASPQENPQRTPGKAESPKSSPAKETPSPIVGPPRLHIVQKGHTLTAISRRYGVTISAICRASGLNEKHPLDVGQIVVIPDKADRDGSIARKARLSGLLDQNTDPNGAGHRYRAYLKKPWKKGYVSVFRHQSEWAGFVLGPKGEVLPKANSKINAFMGGGGEGPNIDERLIRLLAHVSDAFGGRKIRIVSGYRTQSWVADSKHRHGRALDFSIPGVPNEALRDYLRTLPNVGVGYYPNSSFVHLDVREGSAYWVDYSGPGEPPRKHP